MRRNQRNKKFAGHETQKSFRTSHLNLSCQMKNFLKFENIYEYIKIFLVDEAKSFACAILSHPAAHCRMESHTTMWKIYFRAANSQSNRKENYLREENFRVNFE